MGWVTGGSEREEGWHAQEQRKGMGENEKWGVRKERWEGQLFIQQTASTQYTENDFSLFHIH